MDIISKLPSGIIETILCLLPIQEAARTSVLSREWRYHWIKIPKLVFIQKKFDSTRGAELSVLEQTFDRPSKRKKMSKRCKLFYAIYQVLLMHEGQINEFTLSMVADGSCVEIDHIILHLSKKNTVKILKLDINGSYTLPLSFFLLNQLTDLYLRDCVLDHQQSFSGFGNLTALHLEDIKITKKELMRLLSSCPLLKRLALISDAGTIKDEGDSTIADFIECLPCIEYLAVLFFIFLCFVPERLPKEVPTKLVHLKYLCMDYAWFRHKYAAPLLLLLIKSCPNLEKLKLEIFVEESFDESQMGSFVLKDDSGIMLEHLNELEFLNFSNEENEVVVVKVILAKSPVLKTLRILLWDELDKKKKLEISKMILSFPCASPMVKVIITDGKNYY